eukprot:TRINITY_DN1181_c0_g1_i1.p2 TRINITY_DN1181_c0_g1~~TRINITY_DN1181_c0_g1_i1.p2  ORF type:complete len:212 (+),score=42.02 TRINITY_DN1181_c0_g1_i1:388-1023(+)
MNRTLHQQATDFENQANQYAQLNAVLLESANDLNVENQQLKSSNEKLNEGIKMISDRSIKLATTADDLRVENMRLSENFESIKETVQNLQAVEQVLKTFGNPDLGEAIGNLRIILRKQEDALKQQQEIFAKNEEQLKSQERLLLLQLNAQLSFLDHQCGLSQQEYQTFLQQLPSIFQTKNHKSFEELDKNRDGVIDVLEFQALVDYFLKQF